MRFALVLLLAIPTLADDQSAIGAGNAAALELSRGVPRTVTAMRELFHYAGEITNSHLSDATLEILASERACIAHRASLTDRDRREILSQLHAAGLLDDAATLTGVFPPVLDDGTKCPHYPQWFEAAPGGAYGGHHSYPGGLVIHEVFNLTSALAFAASYRHVYGDDLALRMDLVIGAPLWHDWAKVIVYQWNRDGSEFKELFFGGNGKTDNYGATGDSRTGAHHMLGLAEAMSRNLPVENVLAQACAHAAPSTANEYKLVNWIRTAAIIARVDPVERGYLSRDAGGRLHLRPVLLPEYFIHNLSDADYEFTNGSMVIVEGWLEKLAPEFGYAKSEVARYNLRYRNVALAHLTAERLMFVYASSGIAGVRDALQSLRKSGKL